jgi:post-segregation antitoxin (ccd killing protein)
MNTKTKNLKVRLNLQIDKETREVCNLLRDKHHINISSLCREAIINKYKELDENN